MRLLKVATVALSIFAVVGISVKIASADQTPIATPTPGVTTVPHQFEGNYEYVVTDEAAKECKICDYTGPKDSVYIPMRLNGYYVKTIGYGSFSHNDMKKITIPLSVDLVENYAFGYCDKLEEITLENKNATILYNAFAGSENIKTFIYTGLYTDGKALVDSLNLPEGVQIQLMSYPSPTLTSSPTPKPTDTVLPEMTDTNTPTPAPTGAEIPEPTDTNTPTPTLMITVTPTSSPTPEPTDTVLPEVSDTNTPTPTLMITVTPTSTVTPAAEPTVIVSATPTNTVAPTVTAEPTAVVSATPAATATGTPTPTATVTPVIIISATPAVADPTTAPATAKVSGSTYKIKGNKIELTAVSKKATKVVIPSTVKVNGKKYKVTSVSASAFKQAKKLKSVTIGKNIVSIAKNAFKGKADLAKIIVKSSDLKSIGKGAFSGIAKDVTVFIPKKYEKSYKKLFNKAIKSKITYKVV